MRSLLCWVAALAAVISTNAWSPAQVPRRGLPIIPSIPYQGAAPTQLYDSGDPTADEQMVLEMINRARKDPEAEGRRLGTDIKEGLPPQKRSLVRPRPPLAMNKILLSAARMHSADMYEHSYFSHNTKSGKGPAQRIMAAGYTFTACGENIACHSSRGLETLEDMLIVDSGVKGRGHRVNLLDLNSGYTFREVGVGAFVGDQVNSSGFSTLLTQDFGTGMAGPFIVGVVYRDRNGNGTYDPGEGLPGVTITPSQGRYYAITASGGGFVIPSPAIGGTITLTADGGGLQSPVRRNVTLTANNAKMDFVLP
jgi:Cysteine-rich secretory protein family